MLVEKLMIKDTVTVREEDTLEILIKTLIEHKIDGVPVVDPDNRLVGFVSDGDILRAIAPQPVTIYQFYTMISAIEVEMTRETLKEAMKMTVRDIMKKRGLQTVYPRQDLDAVLNILTHHRFKKILVIDGERHVVGIISRGDVIRYLGRLAVEEAG